MSARRGWVERLSGDRTTSTTEPSASRPEPGPDRPVRSNGPERTPLPGPGPRARPPVPDPEGPTLRVVLVSRDNMLAGALRSLIEAPGGVRVLDWYSEELDSAIRHADVVIVDMPPNLHERTFAVIDGRFLGRTVVLLQEGEHAEAPPAGPSRAVLYRPLQIGEFWTAITGAATPVPAAPPQEAEAGSPAPAPEMEEPEAGAEEAADDHAAPGEAEGAAAAVEVAGQGLPVAESGRLIGLSGRELEPVIGPGQVAPGMDEATFERLRRWGRQAPGRTRQPAGKRRTSAGRAEARRAKEAKAEARRAARAAAGRAKAARAEARREQTRQERAGRREARQAARAEVARVRAARAESRTAAREASRQAKAANAEARQVARAESRQARADARQAAQERSHAAKAAKAAARAAAREEARQAKAARAEARAAEQEKAHQAKAAQAEAQAAAREEARRAKAAQAEAQAAAREEARKADAEARAAAQEEARLAKAAQAEARRVARVEAGQAKAARTEARRVARAEARAARSEERRAASAAARQARAAEAAVRRAARTEARQVKAAETRARRAERAEARQVKAAEAKARRAERAEARGVAREEARRARAVRAEARRIARAEAGQARAARREEARQARAARAETRRTARAEARQARAASTEARRERSRQARTAAREEAARARAARAEARQAARAEEERKRAAEAEVHRAQAQQARAEQAEAREAARAEAARRQAEQAEARKVARAEAAQRQAAQAEARKAARAEAARRRAVRAEARKVARAEAAQQRQGRAEARKAARAEAGRKRAERAEARRVARAEARQARGAGAEAWAGAGGVGLLALVVLVVAVVGLVAAGWRGGGGPDGRAGEVAVVRAAGGSDGGLVVQDPRVGPIEPLYALGVGVVLRGSEAGTSLEGAIRDARVPSRYLLAGVVGLTVLLFLLLMRVGPGTGAAAGPGPTPPQRHGRDRLWRLGGAALAGLLVALDPVLVRSGRAATGTVLAVLLALATLALAWGVPARPTLRWLPLVAAGGGLALLVSPLALPVLAVPVVAELLEGRFQEAWRDMAALGIAVGLWLVLPVWVAGQELGAGQAGWLLGRPPGRGSVVASLADDRLTWLLVAGGLAAAMLAWRHRSGARPDPDPPGDPSGPARALAWTMTTAAGAVGAVALGYPASQALPFAVPAAAVSLALAGGWAAAAVRVDRGTGGLVPRWVGAGVAVALAGLLVAQGVDWGASYGGQADDGLGRLVATAGNQVPDCSAVNASGPDDRARLLAAGVTVTEFADGPAAHAAGVRYFVLTGGSAGGGPMTPSLAAWVRRHGTRMAAHPSRSLSGVELWRVDAAPLDPVADSLPVADGLFSNVNGSACGGYRVVDSQVGTFHTAYRAAGGKMVLGRPLGSVWTSDGPALQAFDTMVLGSVPTASGPPAVRPIELPPLLAKLDVEAVADANIPLPSVRPPVTDRQARTLLSEELIARAYLGTDPASASAEDFRRARDRFGRPLGVPQMMPDGAMRQPFERAVLELPAGGGPARLTALGRLAVRLGLVPKQAMRLEPVPGLPAPPAETRLDPAPLLRLIGVGLVLLALAAGAGAVVARRSRTDGAR